LRGGYSLSGLALAATLAAQVWAAEPLSVSVQQSSGRYRDASLDEYRQHLQNLTTLVAACAKARNEIACDPMLVGEDDRIPLSPQAEKRLVRYGWLRVLFASAQEKDVRVTKSPAIQEKEDAGKETKDDKQPEDAPPLPRTVSERLGDAETRLADDLRQSDSAPPPTADYTAQRLAMQKVLAGREFRNLQGDSPWDAVLEKIAKWLNGFFESAGQLGASIPWLGMALVYGFIALVCVGLVWGLMQMERRWRIRLVPEFTGPAAGAASARNWHLWLEDAREAAAQGQWREAIHLMYWATISRLESWRLWPADRARTPREYLSLVAPEDTRRPRLATLTGSFERTWYGGRAASESDYKMAEALALELIEGRTSAQPAAGRGTQ
jgi:hypothetical protein